MRKRIGFLSFGHWQPAAWSQTHTASDALLQTVELAVAAEELGIDGAFVRVHHFARQLASPFPLLAAIGVRTSRIEIGTGVIDMRYENPLYMAEDAAAADLLAGGRLQLGISRGSPEPAWRGAEAFGYSVDPDEARTKTELFRAAIAGAGVVRADAGGEPGAGALAVQPQAAGSLRSDLVGIGLAGDGALDGGAGDEPDELHVAARGHPGALRPAAARADRAVSGRLARGGSRAGAARLGESQRHPDHVRPRPAAVRRRSQPGSGRLPRRRDGALRPHVLR